MIAALLLAGLAVAGVLCAIVTEPARADRRQRRRAYHDTVFRYWIQAMRP